MSNSYKTLWNDDWLKHFTEQVIQSDASTSEEKSLVFWFEDEKTGDLKVNRHILISRFFPALGVRNLVLGKDAKGLETALTVFVNGNRVEEITGEILKSLTFKVIDFYGTLTGDTDTAEEIRSVVGFTKEVFERTGLRSIPDLYDKQVVTDTVSSAFRFFQNGWVEITKEGVSRLHQYDELPEDKIIWNDSVIARVYLSSEDGTVSFAHRDTHYRDFVSNLAMTADGDVCPTTLERLKIAIGYLCHRHHFADARKWVEIVDRDFDVSRQRSDGGNGKSLLIKSLENIMNVTQLDGKEFKKGRSDTFAFANVTPSTEICFFDDADEKFDTARLYSRTTGDFYVRRMRQNPFSIKAEDAPKIVITSNFPLGNNDSSTKRRQFVVEVSSFYREALELYGETPADIHGGKMLAVEGGGWNDTDWSEFHRFVLECLALYLAKGLPARDETSDNFKRSQLIAGFGCDAAESLCDFYLAYLDNLAESGEQVFAHAFYKQVREEFPNLPKEWKDERLYRQLRDVGTAFKVYPNKWMNGNLQQVRLTEDNWQSWVDAGLEDKTKPSGEVFVVGDRVKAFTVARMSTPNPGVFAPDFSVKTIDDEVTTV